MRFVVLQSVLLAILVGSFLLRSGPILFVPPDYVGFMGIGLVVTGSLLVLVALISLGSATRVSPEPKSAILVQRGIYRHVRHPMYTSGILITLGLILIQPRILVAGSGLAVILFYLLKTRFEERLLMKRYPDYGAYRASTRGVLLIKPRSNTDQPDK